MSFNDQDQGQPNAGDQLTFKVGDREFDANSAATKIGAADEHISRIEQENAEFKARLAEMEAKVEQSTKLDDALAQLKAQQQIPQESQTTPETTGVSEEQIGAIATRQIEEHLAAQRAAENAKAQQDLAARTYNETGAALEQIYGDKTNEAMAAKAAELGVSTNELYGMAKSPATAKMLLDSMKASVPASQATPSGSINTSASYHNAPEKFMEYGGNITSSNIVEALKKAEATY
jgi:hypothetical protein